MMEMDFITCSSSLLVMYPQLPTCVKCVSRVGGESLKMDENAIGKVFEMDENAIGKVF